MGSRCHRWVQLSHKEMECLNKMLGKRKNSWQSSPIWPGWCGDDWVLGQWLYGTPPKIQDRKHPEFGQSSSVRSVWGEKPINIFGQDKEIYNQNSSNTYPWVGPNGERPLLPKNNGIGNMISAFQSRESSRGIEMADEHLHQVNLGKRGSASLIRKQPAQFWIQQKWDYSQKHHLLDWIWWYKWLLDIQPYHYQSWTHIDCLNIVFQDH
jgi:hypothetical protein